MPKTVKKKMTKDEKVALRQAIKAKKAQWHEEDLVQDQKTRDNIISIQEEYETSKAKLDEYKKALKDDAEKARIALQEQLQACKNQLAEYRNALKEDPENADLKQKLEASKANQAECMKALKGNPGNAALKEEFISFNKEHERIGQRLRIEKRRLSVAYKIDRWSKRGSRLRRELYIKRQYYYLVAPFTILFIIFTVLPVLMSLVISFTSFNLLEFPEWVGWNNYMRLFIDDKIFVIAIRNTLILAVVTGPLSYIAAFVFAWLINELKPRLRAFMTLIFYAPSISGNVYLVWKLIFASDIYGYANAFLIRWGFINEPITWLQDPKYIIYIVMVVQLWLSLGVSFLAFIAGLQNVNRELYEAGAVDGIKNRWQELWYITLPQMKSQLMFGAVMQITASLAIAEVTTNIAGFPSIQYSAHTIINHLQDYGNLRLEMGYASAIATILFLIMIVANIYVRKIIRRVGN